MSPRPSSRRRLPIGSAALWTPLCLVALALLANVLLLTGAFDSNPADTLSGTGTTTSAGLLPGQSYLDPNVGISSQAFGHLAARDLLAGHMPWWNPYEGTGAPLAAEMNSAALFPPTLLLGSATGQAWEHLLLEVAAGLSTYALMRRLSVGRLAAFVAGAVFELAGTFAWLFHAPGNSVALLPLALLGVEVTRQGVEEGRWSRGWVIIAGAIALSWYAGFPEATALDGLLIGLWLLARLPGLRRRSCVRLLLLAGAGAAAGTALAAPLLLPFAEYLRVADLGSHAGGFAHQSLPPSAWPGLVMPYVFGPLFGWLQPNPSPIIGMWSGIGGYLTAALTVVAAIGACGPRHRPLRLVLAAWCALCVARVYGVRPVETLLAVVPGIASIQFSRFCPTSFELAATVLAALAVDDLSVGALRRLPALVVVGAGAGGLALAALEAARVLHPVVGAPEKRAWAVASVLWAAVCLAVVGGAVLFRRHGSIAVAVLLSVDAAVMFVVPELSAPRHVTIDAAPVAYLRAHLGESRMFTIGTLQPDYGSYYGLAQADISDTPLPASYATWITSRLDPVANPVIFTGMGASTPGSNYADAFAAHLQSYEATGVKYLVVPQGEALPQPQLATLAKVWADQLVVIYALPAPAPFFSAPGCVVRSPDIDHASLDCLHPSTLVRLETDTSGWRVQSSLPSGSSRALPIGSYEGLFQRVPVPAGTSTLEWSYSPPRVDLGYLAAALAVLAALAHVTVRWRRAPSSPQRPLHARG